MNETSYEMQGTAGHPSQPPDHPLPQLPAESFEYAVGASCKSNKALVVLLTSLHLQRQDLEAQLDTLGSFLKNLGCPNGDLPP